MLYDTSIDTISFPQFLQMPCFSSSWYWPGWQACGKIEPLGHLCPFGQIWQKCCSVWFAKCPTGQIFWSDNLISGQKCPFSHLKHESNPVEFAKLPFLHALQAPCSLLLFDVPGRIFKILIHIWRLQFIYHQSFLEKVLNPFPFGQSNIFPSQNFPGGHFLQNVWPVLFWKYPGAQGWQAALFASPANVCSGQGWHWANIFPAYVP